jgi:hypothetical protein
MAAPQGPINISPAFATNNGGASRGPSNAFHNAPNGGGPLLSGPSKPVSAIPVGPSDSRLQPAASTTQDKVQRVSK